MKTIYKYNVPVTDHPVVVLPRGAKILTVGAQQNYIYVWALVDSTKKPEVTRQFRLVGTGHPIEKDNLRFIGTVFVACLVYHLFEVVK